ncbi:MAG: hypothetical protein AB2417_02510 [Clostridiaceae bacterium]
MKYYFFNEKGEVDLIYSIEPPAELGDRYVKSDEVFEEKEGYILRLKVIGGVLKPEYIQKPKGKYDLLLAENEATKKALGELTLLVSTMTGGM